jgi:hypothetical protein
MAQSELKLRNEAACVQPRRLVGLSAAGFADEILVHAASSTPLSDAFIAHLPVWKPRRLCTQASDWSGEGEFASIWRAPPRKALQPRQLRAKLSIQTSKQSGLSRQTAWVSHVWEYPPAFTADSILSPWYLSWNWIAFCDLEAIQAPSSETRVVPRPPLLCFRESP